MHINTSSGVYSGDKRKVNADRSMRQTIRSERLRLQVSLFAHYAQLLYNPAALLYRIPKFLSPRVTYRAVKGTIVLSD